MRKKSFFKFLFCGIRGDIQKDGLVKFLATSLMSVAKIILIFVFSIILALDAGDEIEEEGYYVE